MSYCLAGKNPEGKARILATNMPAGEKDNLFEYYTSLGFTELTWGRVIRADQTLEATPPIPAKVTAKPRPKAAPDWIKARRIQIKDRLSVRAFLRRSLIGDLLP